MANINEYSVKEAQNIQLGQAGGKFINDGEEHSGTFVAIQILTNATFEELIPNDTTNGYGVGNSYNGNSLSGVAVPAGNIIYGNWSKIELSGGSVIAYLG
tara:strand:- start:125 stop:424 length:300 start_codon:yes stop_codon:yes gene_type:complete